MIRNYRQFVNWRPVPSATKPGKFDKVPFNPRTGNDIDPHNPVNWKSFDEAYATGHPTGFSLSEADPFFFYDLDGVLQSDGTWSQEAIDVCTALAGAAVEVSYSGTGLHIIGQCQKFLFADKKNKFGNGTHEFYVNRRLIAFGHGWVQGWQGQFDVDCTAQLLRIVPDRDPFELVDLTAGPCPEYTGPEDDDTLIEKALRSNSMGSLFGDRATFEHLWTGNAAVLSQLYPSMNGDVYDRSSADAALMSHLAFWTGKDAARMDRLFRRSALMRDKYELRKDYGPNTIKKAVSLCKKVYDAPRPAQRIQNISTNLAEGNAPPLPSGEYMDIATQIQYFAGCTYILESHRVLTKDGDLLRAEQFKTFYGGYEFAMTGDNSKPTRNAFEAFTENRVHNFPKVKRTIFRPHLQPGGIYGDAVNVYFPIEVERTPGDVTPFLDLLQRLLPHERDRRIVLTYMAAMVQNIGTKFQWAVVLQGTQGNGKTFLAKCLEHAIGKKFCHSPAAEDMANPFNSYLENKLLITVEEIHMSGRREILDTLKPLITNETIEIQPKGIDKRMVDNLANWWFTTNHRDAVIKTENDRRYSIFFTAQQNALDLERWGMGGNYFPALWKWARSGGFANITDYLFNYQCDPEFNPADGCHRAPATSSTELAIRATLGTIEQMTIEAIEAGEMGFRNGWISSTMLQDISRKCKVRLSPNKQHEVAEALGYVAAVRSPRFIMEEGGSKPTLYLRREMYHPNVQLEDYLAAQGYTSAELRMPGVR